MNQIIKDFEAFVMDAHRFQTRKYTNEPYHTHCFEVRDICVQYGYDDIVSQCVALGHDLLEDTKVKYMDLFYFFDSYKAFGGVLQSQTSQIVYNEKMQIINGIQFLTDEYTPEYYPDINRRDRKQLEAKRLSNIHPKLQTIKYADIISNTSSIIEHDPKFAKVYLAEKRYLLEVMDKGDRRMYDACRQICQSLN